MPERAAEHFVTPREHFNTKALNGYPQTDRLTQSKWLYPNSVGKGEMNMNVQAMEGLLGACSQIKLSDTSMMEHNIKDIF